MLTIKSLSESTESALLEASRYAPYLRQSVEALERWGLPAPTGEGSLNQALKMIVSPSDDMVSTQRRLRQAKRLAHVSIASLDLSGVWDLDGVTRAMSDLADASSQTALLTALQQDHLQPEGLVLIALGKMGARELNYSSDIDLAAFVDADRFDGGSREPVEAASRVVRNAMAMLHDRTEDGYVFRTDLRLRPDPSSTPLAVATRRAELYYESAGQNWERMVWIKARAAAGDLSVGHTLINTLEPFIWRRHLDYWAIADVHAIKAMINSKVGDHDVANAAADVKLGSGGIREIEFFAQTQQIILGGRSPALRTPKTIDTLQGLARAGVVKSSVAEELSAAYRALRAVEHRIQMLDDEQSHTLPAFESRRAAVAALSGYSELAAFDQAVLETRKLVHHHYSELFAHENRKREQALEGNLVFTGVDDDPNTVATLKGLGFEDASQVIQSIRQWHRGRTPATRTTRGRELLTAILPDLLQNMGKTGEADGALRRFSRFFERLRSGVQVLSMLAAKPDLLTDLVSTLALAPMIADSLGTRPGLLEALISPEDRKAAPKITQNMTFEEGMDGVRHWYAERAFLVGHSLLHGMTAAADAAEAWTSLAQTCIELMSEAALNETVRRYGPAPGAWTICALGKMGGAEMTAGSDLDLLVIYDAGDNLDAQTWFTRFTQRLITALSAQTGEGQLYEVDMRLRPSGRAGPVATSLSAFERYHKQDAWTWEHMALTRLRPIVGDDDLGERVLTIVGEVLSEGDEQKRTKDILEMRARLVRDKPATGPWDLKMRTGGLVDLEFIVQHALLTNPNRNRRHQPHLPDAIAQLDDEECLAHDEAELLTSSFRFLQSLQQVQRLALGPQTLEEHISAGLADRLCRATGHVSFQALEEQLEKQSEAVTALFSKKVGVLPTEF